MVKYVLSILFALGYLTFISGEEPLNSGIYLVKNGCSVYVGYKVDAKEGISRKTLTKYELAVNLLAYNGFALEKRASFIPPEVVKIRVDYEIPNSLLVERVIKVAPGMMERNIYDCRFPEIVQGIVGFIDSTIAYSTVNDTGFANGKLIGIYTSYDDTFFVYSSLPDKNKKVSSKQLLKIYGPKTLNFSDIKDAFDPKNFGGANKNWAELRINGVIVK